MPKNSFKRISVVGLGYIGLPTAAMFASRKIEVIGVDVNKATVETINSGNVHIVEPGLDMVVHAVVQEGYLKATMVPERAEAFLIAVPTPFYGDDHTPDLSYISAAASAIAPVLEPGNLVILESTSPVGTTEKLANWLADARPDLTFPQTAGEQSDIRIAHCPERVLPGNVMQELITNDRIIGGITPTCSAKAIDLYKTFVSGQCVLASGPGIAEMAKLTENSFRDVNIAFANELSLICDTLNMDVWELISLANRHPRVNILQPGPGVGGHCIAVDPWFIVSAAPEQSVLIKSARQVNASKPDWTLEKFRIAVRQHLLENPGKSAADVTVSIFGLAFKPNIDDLRESPALEVARAICSIASGPIYIVEPNISELPEGLGQAQLVSGDGLRADICVVLVKHSQFARDTIDASDVIDVVGLSAKQKRQNE